MQALYVAEQTVLIAHSVPYTNQLMALVVIREPKACNGQTTLAMLQPVNGLRSTALQQSKQSSLHSA